MSFDSIGRRYAQAIFEIAKEEGDATTIARQLQEFAAVYASSDELRSVLESPLVESEARQSIVVEIAQKLGTSPVTSKAIRLITRKRRMRALPDIARHLERLVDQDAKVVRAEVMSAGPLSASYLERLRAELEKATQTKVVLSHSVDPSLIGGVVTRIGDRVIDGSIRSRLFGFGASVEPRA